MLQKKRNIRFEKNTVIKIASPELMRIEVEKTKRAFEIANDCKLFRVPEVLDYDEAKGIVVFEYIKNIQPIATKWMNSHNIVEKTGISLAIIHRLLSLPEKMIIPLPYKFNLAGSEVFLHGDFNGSNICVDENHKQIIILDWQMTYRYGGKATYGSRYFDLFWFVSSMLWHPTIRHFFNNPVIPVAKRYLLSYFRESKTEYNLEELNIYTKLFFDIELIKRKHSTTKRSRILVPRIPKLTGQFIESLRAIKP